MSRFSSFNRSRSAPANSPSLSAIMLTPLLGLLVACQGGGGGGGDETLNSPGGGYGVTSNVGTMDEDLIQNESPNQDPFADNPDPIPN